MPKISSFLFVLISLLHFPLIMGQPHTHADFDLNGKRVIYYPDALMISHNPHAIVFYKNTKLFNLYINLRNPTTGKQFEIANPCSDDQSKFLTELLLQLRNVQKVTQRLLSSPGLTSLIECDSYIRRFYQYSTGLSASMNCPYGYRQSLEQCKVWALKTCSNISPHERSWLSRSRRQKRSLPWACTAGLAGIPRFFYTKFGGSCESGDLIGVLTMLTKMIDSSNTLHDMIKVVNGKTVYLAKVTDQLVAKSNSLGFSLKRVDIILRDWQSKLQQFSLTENCHFNNFMEFLSKFSVEVTREFSSLLRYMEIKDILHEAHKLHKRNLVGYDDLPSFLSSELDLRLQRITSLTDTATALHAGLPLLLRPMVDYDYHLPKSFGINILFTIPELVSSSSICVVEYLTPLKYKIGNQCYQGPVSDDRLVLLRCDHQEYLLRMDLLDKCYHSDNTFVCPQHLLHFVNDTFWLGLPWTQQSKQSFARRHQSAKDCSNLQNMLHLGGRHYLATQTGRLTVHNNTNGSSHSISLSPLIVYHFPCDLTFADQQTGFGSCPDRITLHIPLFTTSSFRYVPWQNDQSTLLHLHYQSLNISPPVQFDNSTLQSLDKTYNLLNDQFKTQLATLKQDFSHIHLEQRTRVNDFFTYFAVSISLLNTICLIILFRCCLPRNPIRTRVLFRRKSAQLSRETKNANSAELTQIIPASPAESSAPPADLCDTCHKEIATDTATSI